MHKYLNNKLYLKLLTADIISNFGDVLYYMALMNYALQISNSNKAIAIISLSELIPPLFSILLGYYADKCKRRVSAIIRTLIYRFVFYLVIAFLTGFTPSLIIVVLISFINLLSDSLGLYENGLYYPISHKMVKDEDREEVMAIRHSITISFQVMFEAIGGVAILVFSMKRLALVNASTFLISMMIIFISQKEIFQIYQDETTAYSENDRQYTEKGKMVLNELRESLSQLKNIAEMKGLLLAFPVLNGGLAVITSLVVLHISEYSSFVFYNAEITLSVLAIVQTVGRIIGSMMVLNLFKKLSLRSGVFLTLCFNVLMFTGILINSEVFTFFCLLVSSLFTGCLDPKLGALIFSSIDEKKLATAFGGATTYFQIGDIISRGIFALSAFFLNSIWISWLFLSLSIYSCLLIFCSSN